LKKLSSWRRVLPQKIVKDKLFGQSPDKKRQLSKPVQKSIQEVDLESMEQLQSREIGGEWLVKQVFDVLGIAPILEGAGLRGTQVDIAQMLVTGKLLYPSSETGGRKMAEGKFRCPGAVRHKGGC
jgi:hypothetical protein